MKLALNDKTINLYLWYWNKYPHQVVLNKNDQLKFKSPGKDIQFLSYQYQVHGKVLKRLMSLCKPELAPLLPSSLAGTQLLQHIYHCSKLKDKGKQSILGKWKIHSACPLYTHPFFGYHPYYQAQTKAEISNKLVRLRKSSML